MMKPMILITCLFFFISSQAQFEKKTLKAIEKQACFIPADTVVISQTSIEVGARRDSLFGKTIVNGLPGWGRYFVNLEGAVSKPVIFDKRITDAVDIYVQVGIKKLAVSSYEVSNKEYGEFVNWTRINRPEQIHNVLLDSQKWSSVGYKNSPMINYYHHHPAYHKYPVTNVSHEQTRLYLEWLTEQYNSSPKRKYKKVIFRLPTEAEWMYAYLGNTTEYGATHGGNFRRSNGQITANFILFEPATQLLLQDSAYVHVSDSTLSLTWTIKSYSNSDTIPVIRMYKPRILNFTEGVHSSHSGMYTTPVESYWPNGFGIYNMAGNVAEFVAEEGIVKGGHWHTTGFYLMPTSRETFLDQPSASPTRGFRWVMEVIEE